MPFALRPAARRLAATAGLTALVLTPTAFGVTASAVAAEEGQKVTLLNFNDYHGKITSSKDFACVITQERAGAAADGSTSFLLSAGDNVGGTEFESFILQDQPSLDYLNALGLDASAIGNHEFDQGQEDLNNRIIPEAEFPYLSANIYKADGSLAYDAYEIVERDGVRIAVIGATTTKTVGKVAPAGIEGLTFGDPVEGVNAAVQELEDSGAQYDMIIAEYHEGASGNGEVGSAPANNDPIFDKIVTETDPRVDAIFNGDSHRTYAYNAPQPDGNGERPIVQTGASAGYLSSVTLVAGANEGEWTVETNELVANDLEDGVAEESCVGDPVYDAAAAIIDKAEADAAEAGSVPVGSITGDITTSWDDSKAEYQDGVWTRTDQSSPKGDNRTRHSAAGNLIADSMVWSAQQTGRYDGQELIGWMNPGGIRAEQWYAPTGSEDDGVITYSEAAEQLPFGNSLYTTEVTGADFVQMLEEQWVRSADGTPSDSFLAFHASNNVTYTIDPTAELDAHIVDVQINGEPIDLEGTYTIVGADFVVRDGGDNQHTLRAAGENTRDLGIVDRDAYAEYLRAHENIAPNFEARQVAIEWLEGGEIRWEGDNVITDTDPVLRLSGLESQSIGAPELASVTISTPYGAFTGEYTYHEPVEANEEEGIEAVAGGWWADVTLTDWKCVPMSDDPIEATITTTAVNAEVETGTEIITTLFSFESVEGDGGTPPGCEAPAPEPSDPGNDQGGNDGEDDEQGEDDGQGQDDQGQGAPSDKPSTKPSAPAQPEGENTAGSHNSGPSSLARTGMEAGGLAALAAGLVAAGGLALRAARRNHG